MIRTQNVKVKVEHWNYFFVVVVPSRLSFLSEEFDLSASAKNAASSPMLLSIKLESFNKAQKNAVYNSSQDPQALCCA